MKRVPNLVLAVIFTAAVAIAAGQGVRVRHLRESEAFYRWILAAATQERLFQSKAEDKIEAGAADVQYRDRELLAQVANRVVALLPDVPPDPNVPEDRTVSKLSLVAGDRTHDKLIWNLARGSVLDTERAEFLRDARARKLEYALDIQYAEAQASGVSVFNLFFGFRKVAANFVWIQVDRYWHQGMMYRMIPLMKTCVTLDPNFVDAYLLGSWHLAYNATAKMTNTPQPLKQWNPKYQACVGEKESYYYLGADFLKDGILNNPRDYRLYFDLGFAIYKIKLLDYANAVKYLAEAIRQPHDRWVPRQLYLCQELNGQYEDALAGWKDYIRRYPKTETAIDVAPRFIQRNTALIYEKHWEQTLDAAKKAADPAEAQALRQEAENAKQKALEVWNSLDEPYAVYRKARIDAIDLTGQGRYMEAVAVLDKARWENPSSFDEASEQIITIKIKGNLPLSVSEKKAVLRREEGDSCPGAPQQLQQG